MSAAFTHWVWTTSPASGTQKLVLLALADNADRYGRVALSQGAIAALCGVSQTRVRQILEQLVQSNALAVLKQGQGGTSANVYKIICGDNEAGHALRTSPPDAPEKGTAHKVDLPSPQPEKEGKNGNIRAADFAAPQDITAAAAPPVWPMTVQPDQIAKHEVDMVLNAAGIPQRADQPLYWSRLEHREALRLVLKRTGLSVIDLCRALEEAHAAGHVFDPPPNRLDQIDAHLKIDGGAR